jgi:hypothetical protein
MLQRTTRKPVSSSDAVSTDIDELQRQYRLMELTRKAHSDEKANNVRMQRASMEKLKRDNDRLKEDLALETRQAKHANNMSASAQIAKLQDQGDLYTRKIEIERRRIEELEKQIGRIEKHILDQRREMGGVNASRENNTSVQKQIRILENRLDKALVKFNEALAHNKNLRETIDNLRRERVVFDGIYKKLEEELHTKKNTMATILQDSDAAYKARDQAHSEMIALKAAADQQQQNFEQEWSQLGQLIEKDRKLKDFIKNQQRERSLKGLSDPAAEEEQKLRKKVNKGAWGIAKDKANIHLSMEKVQSYEEAFAKIQKATKITDIDELVQTFVQAEDQNFSLFNYVNDLSHEIEKIEENIGELKGEIEKYQANNPTSAAPDVNARNDPQVGSMGGRESQEVVLKDGEKPRLNADGVPILDAGPIGPSDSQRKKMMMELEGKLARTEGQAVVYDEKYHSALKTVSVLKQGIQNLFFKIGCQNLAASEMLGSAGVTESNMMQYLGIIEERTNELVTQLLGTREENSALSNQLKNEDEDAAMGQSQGGAGQIGGITGGYSSEAVSITAPRVGDLDGDEDGEEGEDGADGQGGDEEDADEGDEERPLSERELRGGDEDEQ